jgi:hypothetical protein
LLIWLIAPVVPVQTPNAMLATVPPRRYALDAKLKILLRALYSQGNAAILLLFQDVLPAIRQQEQFASPAYFRSL